MHAETHWAFSLDAPRLHRLIGERAFRHALTSHLKYVTPPELGEGVLRAEVGDAGVPTARVELRMPAGNALLGDCSRCIPSFGPCVHMAVVAVDLACSKRLRDALRASDGVTCAFAEAPARRLEVRVDREFEGSLEAWLGPTAAAGMHVEIAANPFAEIDTHGRPYGDTRDARDEPALSIVVRRRGERKLFTPQEIKSLAGFGAKDRRVIEYVQGRGVGRKALFALGVDASLTIEAMRAHGGCFGANYKGILDFRQDAVRPTIALVPAAGAVAFDALTAFWEGGAGTQVAFVDSAFFTGPFPYVWTKGGAIYRVARDVDLDFARELSRAPVLRVPKERLKDAGARLFRSVRGRGVALPDHEAFGLPPIETPRIVLRLRGDPLAVFGDLFAVYRTREFALFTASDEEGRDLSLEARARAHVIASGLATSDEDYDAEDDEPRVGVSGEKAVAFWQHGMVAIREAEDPKIEIELSEKLARVKVGAPITGRVHAVLEGNWLDTRLEFASKDVGVELASIRAALSQKQRWVSLDDGTLTRISGAIEALAEEAMETLGRDGHALLPPHQLGRLDRWLEENDGRIDIAIEGLRKRLRALAVATEPEMPEGLVATLRPYQKLGLAWLQFLQALGAGGILADDMGLGKTITTLAFLLRRKEAEGPAPSLVVCPTSVATNWVREAARFTPGLRVALLHGPSRDAGVIARSDIVVTTYALLRRDLSALSTVPFRCVVLDEAQNIKNADSATTRAAGKLDASMRLALSGTPIENRLGELWSLASFANPGMLGSRSAFETRFERPITTDRGSPLAAELRAVVRPFILRRTKDEVLRELPPKTEIDRVVTLTTTAKRRYDALALTLRESVQKDIEKRGHLSLSVFTALIRLRQMACDPRLVDPRAQPKESAKREAFLDIVHELMAEGRRALVFSQFVELLTLWRQDLDAEKIAYEYLDGSTTKRDLVVTRFQEGKAPLFLISLKAGGAGLNLTAADTVIHCDPWWNPAVEDQATDRAYRIGQDKPVTVIRLVARGTIEEKILSLKEKKRELTRAVIGDDSRALEGITEGDLRGLLGGEEGDDEGDEDEPRGLPDDKMATDTRVLDPVFFKLIEEAKWWLVSTGHLESELASKVDIPVAYASRLARGEPFPCSRRVAERIRARLKVF